MKKRLLALALCLVMLIGLVPTAFADGVVTHTVSFNPDGGTPAPANQTVVHNGFATKPTVSLDGYRLDGWYAVGEQNRWSFAYSPVTTDLVLTARWEKMISYNGNAANATGSTESQIAYKGGSVTLKANGFTRTGYRMTGWATVPNASAAEYQENQTVQVSELPKGTDGEVTLYAVWQAIDPTDYYTVTYRQVGAPGADYTVQVQKAASGATTYTALATLPTVGGWETPVHKVFDDKWKNAATGEEYTTNKPITLTGDLVLNPVYRNDADAKFSVTYYNDIRYAGTEKTEQIESYPYRVKTYAEAKNGAAAAWTQPTGKSFLRWETMSGVRYLPGQLINEAELTGDLALYAVYQADSYTITFYCYTDGKNDQITVPYGAAIRIDPNGGSYQGRTTVTTFLADADAVIADADAVYSGHTFRGWYVAQTGSTYTFTAMWSKAGVSCDVYYYDYDDGKYEYARFTTGTYLIIDPNGGTAKLNNTSFSTRQAFYINDDYTLSDAARTGYTFYGWDLTKSGSTYTFTAMWSKSASTVPYMLNGEDHYAYIKGYPNGSFKPNATITRAEAASIFYRLLTDTTRKTYTTTYNTFKDVPAKAWYNTAVSTMAKLGIVDGDANGYFRPSDPITRAEIAAMIARCDGSYYGSSYTNFSDVKGHWASSYIARAYELGWINGYGTTYAPDKYISRAETVAILNRVLNRAPQYTSDLLSGRNTFSDVSTASWYYLDVEEAANSHTYTRKTSGYEYWNKLIADPSWL